MGRVGVCRLCACDSDDSEHGVGTGVNDTMLSETLEVITLVESVTRVFRSKKKTMNLSVRSEPLCVLFIMKRQREN